VLVAQAPKPPAESKAADAKGAESDTKVRSAKDAKDGKDAHAKDAKSGS
jgi:hypothetical protein